MKKSELFSEVIEKANKKGLDVLVLHSDQKKGSWKDTDLVIDELTMKLEVKKIPTYLSEPKTVFAKVIADDKDKYVVFNLEDLLAWLASIRIYRKKAGEI